MAGRIAPPEIHLNLNVRGMNPSATLAVNETSNRLRSDGRRVYKLGLGQSPFPVPPQVVEALQANAHQRDYLPVMGLEELREASSRYLERTQGVARGREAVLVGPGSKELMFLLQLVYYGDLIIPTPAWVSYAPQARIIGRNVQWVPTTAHHGWRLMPEDLDRICSEDEGRPRIVVLNYPANPTGCSYTTEELKSLARVARRHRVVLLSDEIYGELHHKGRHVSVARFYPEGTIISGGLSKWCAAGGWRLGLFSFPPQLRWLRDAMGAAASQTYTSTCTPIQYAAVRAYRGGLSIERYLRGARRILGALGRDIAGRLRKGGAEVASPDGGFYLFPDFGVHAERMAARGIRSGGELCGRLLHETGVALLPGSEFGRPEGELTARLSYVDFDGARALAAAEAAPRGEALSEEFLREHCRPTLEAVDRLVDWVHS